MSRYIIAQKDLWTGRKSDQDLYLHEKVQFLNLENDALSNSSEKRIALLGYACDEGVRRNQGRIGAAEGPDAIRKQLAKMPNHLSSKTQFIDAGIVSCDSGAMEAAQSKLAQQVTRLLKNKTFPILLGGGHDIAYGHYKGIQNYLGKNKSIGIINFDAHFDLRSNEYGNNSGTPFYQIAQEEQQAQGSFNYLCLGIRKDANDRKLFQTASNYGVSFIENENFNVNNIKQISTKVSEFLGDLDYIYVTIDLDGFSSAYAPGVSAASPMGFSPAIVLRILEQIIFSKKLISLDLAELNPKFDRDNQTAKLAASLIFSVINKI